MLARGSQYYPVVDASFDHGSANDVGWLSFSADHGGRAVWPGDTTGLSTLSPTDVVASWGSDYPDMSGNQSEVYAANVTP
jgi:hypothetical protein